ncbi:DUF3263 domain-containing protein [Streptomyces sp. NPDC006551]|uniref:DUF3263 domain-containing protein n=1 Tax=Streptomyces sp. NPDC006551 TaxID=3157178 RepID=UPI0033B97A24
MTSDEEPGTGRGEQPGASRGEEPGAGGRGLGEQSGASRGEEPGAGGRSVGEPGAGDPGLGERERAVLALERRSWPGPGAKERAVRERLGLSPVRYYQLLNALLDDPRALEHDPVTVNRLRRVRAEKEQRR